MSRWAPVTIPARGDHGPRDERDIPLEFTPAAERPPAGDPMSHAPVLSLNQARRVVHLQTEIGALRQAQACVTEAATPSQVYGRLDDLIQQRNAELEGLFTTSFSNPHD
ncbi:hypothetical protein [Pseudoxanthomonas sp. USHLN014]|uniref:hypothetical protein n=1 Tax=Pseudoxanthomonas sp. USHLN014 TaxID=3081297 RepID=UPI00301C4929